MAMSADDDPIRLTPRLTDPSEIVFKVPGVDFSGNRKDFVQYITIPQQHDLCCVIVGDFLVTVEVLARSLFAHLETKLAAHALLLFKSCFVYVIGCVKSQRVDSRSATPIRPLLAGLVPLSKRRGYCDQRDSTVGRIEISWGSRLREILARAGMHNPCFIQMTNVRQHSALAIVESVIVGAGNHVNAEPFQVIEEFRLRRHESSLGDSRCPFVPGVHAAFEIREGRIAAIDNLTQPQKPFFLKRCEFPSEHRIARECESEISFFRFVKHGGLLFSSQVYNSITSAPSLCDRSGSIHCNGSPASSAAESLSFLPEPVS